MTQHSDEEQQGAIALADGRRLSYATLGASQGPLVVVLDGPGSRGLFRAAAPAATELGIRLVAPDRPGFGETPLDPARGIADWPADHGALLDALGADSAGILGQSGGTPYALATAAALVPRTTGVALLGPMAPLSEPENLADVSRQIRSAAKLSLRAPWLLRAGLRAAGRSARKDPEKAARKGAKHVPPADAEVVADPAIWSLHVRATTEILSQADAVVHEIGLLARPWGFDLAAVAVPVAFWSGDRDETHPTSHARRLAERVGGAPVHVVQAAATFGLLPQYPAALRFATTGS